MYKYFGKTPCAHLKAVYLCLSLVAQTPKCVRAAVRCRLNSNSSMEVQFCFVAMSCGAIVRIRNMAFST